MLNAPAPEGWVGVPVIVHLDLPRPGSVVIASNIRHWIVRSARPDLIRRLYVMGPPDGDVTLHGHAVIRLGTFGDDRSSASLLRYLRERGAQPVVD